MLLVVGVARGVGGGGCSGVVTKDDRLPVFTHYVIVLEDGLQSILSNCT